MGDKKFSRLKTFGGRGGELTARSASGFWYLLDVPLTL